MQITSRTLNPGVLLDLARKGEFAAVLDKHYSDDIVSIEPVAGPNMPAKQEGIAAIRAKPKIVAIFSGQAAERSVSR